MQIANKRRADTAVRISAGATLLPGWRMSYKGRHLEAIPYQWDDLTVKENRKLAADLYRDARRQLRQPG